MKLYLNAGFGYPLPDADLALISRLGFEGVRQDVTDWANLDHIRMLLVNFAPFPRLRPLLVLNELPTPERAATQTGQIAQLVRETGIEADVEIGNETDGKGTPAQFREALLAAARVPRPSFVRVISGGITSLMRRRLDYLRKVDPSTTGVDAVGFHSYRPQFHEWEDGLEMQRGFDGLRKIAGGLPLWNTEIGWHTKTTTYHKGPFGIFTGRIQYTDPEVAQLLVSEARNSYLQGAQAMTVYQLNDGPSDTNSMDHYGIRRVDGTLKPSASVPALYARL